MKTNATSHKARSNPTSLAKALASSKATRIENLSVDGMLLHQLFTLVVDIEYRNKYGESIEEQSSRGYSKYQNDEVLTDQTPPVDSGLSGTSQREMFDDV